jgi:acetyltransferase-like isoleucine patch superfamily enzyme
MAAYGYVIGGDHDFSDPAKAVLAQSRTSTGVVIGDGVWMGAGAKVLDGVEIGPLAVIGAAAVVREKRSGLGDRRRHSRTRRLHARLRAIV